MSTRTPKTKPLAAIRSRFLNLRAMAAELGTFADFHGVGHPTLVRWLKAEDDGEELPRRARRAIELLSVKRTETLRIPFQDSPVALPLLILAARKADAPQDGGFAIERMEAHSGIEALLQVSRHDADVAVAWEDVKLPAASRGACAALCNYVSYDLDGIFIERKDKPIKTRIDLRKIKFGFPGTSAVGEFLKSEITFEKASGLSPVAMASAKGAATALQKNEVDCLVGWHPWLTNARKELKQGQAQDLPAGLLPPIRLALFVSKASKKGPAILQFLRELAGVVKREDGKNAMDAALRALEEKQLQDLAKRIGVEKATAPREQLLEQVHALVVGYDFGLTDADLNVLFCIWREAEVAAAP